MASTAIGQKVKFFGKFVVEKGNMDKAVIYIEKNGVPVKTIYPDGQKFDFVCDLNADYLFKFEKPGYITKKISINTNIDKDRAEEGFDPYRFNVYLFPQVEGVNTVIFNQPVGKIMYKPDLDDIGFDTDYTKSIEAEMKDFEAEYKAKEKEASPIPPPVAVAQATPPPPVIVPPPVPQASGGPSPPPNQFVEVKKDPPKQVAINPVIESEPPRKLNPIVEQEAPRKLNAAIEEERPKKIAVAMEEEKPKKAMPVAEAQEYRKFNTGSEDSERRKALLAAEEDERRRKMLAAMSDDEQRRNTVAARIEEEKRMQYPKARNLSYQRTENYLKEPNREITEIILSSEFSVVVFRKVQCDFGQIYYFKNNYSICKWMYDNAFANMKGG